MPVRIRWARTIDLLIVEYEGCYSEDDAITAIRAFEANENFQHAQQILVNMSNVTEISATTQQRDDLRPRLFSIVKSDPTLLALYSSSSVGISLAISMASLWDHASHVIAMWTQEAEDLETFFMIDHQTILNELSVI